MAGGMLQCSRVAGGGMRRYLVGAQCAVGVGGAGSAPGAVGRVRWCYRGCCGPGLPLRQSLAVLNPRSAGAFRGVGEQAPSPIRKLDDGCRQTWDFDDPFRIPFTRTGTRRQVPFRIARSRPEACISYCQPRDGCRIRACRHCWSIGRETSVLSSVELFCRKYSRMHERRVSVGQGGEGLEVDK
ncbi:hypothetical protein F5X68DRAFT_59307 [Plectosphaerella plurivora]|uniref:Uncharacterized protein n=1 Tax=Plectosphaerella plurivora TaxID=936078 RepID=A0A9P9AF46_9PEZI|nr:hypothetical protein F5X68DRAFT_59307 [Plectosphaerella plurivora]